MWYLLSEYIKFLFKSTNQHGVHSPFVFQLVTKCFYDKKNTSRYEHFNNFRRHLFNNHNAITVTDFGAGSKVFKSNRRTISKIAKNAGIPLKRAQLLFRLVQYTKSHDILELGTSIGMATSAMAYANPKAHITTIEGCPETAKVANIQFKKFNLNNIHLEVGRFDDVLPKLKNQTYDIIYIDGNHQKEATLMYFNTLSKSVHNDSIVIIDDIHWSKEMTEAWQQIKELPKVTITIDTFFWGMVFFRKEQAKEHFIIRV